MGCGASNEYSRVNTLPTESYAQRQRPRVQNHEYDYLFKILLVGDTGVGKSSLITRFVDDLYSDMFISTIGVDFKIRTADIDGSRVKMQIWDTAGQERFRTITSSYYRGSHGIIIVYDVCRLDTFQSISKWVKEIEKYSNGNCIKVVCGNKTDFKSETKVDRDMAESWCRTVGLSHFETSARTNYCVSDMFFTIAQMIKTKQGDFKE